MPRILFYITSHGFGHATREIEVINHIPNEIEVEIITAAPKWLFEKSLRRPFDYFDFSHDPGISQSDSLTQDVPRTFDQWRHLLDSYPQMAAREADRIRSAGASVVVGDISPFAPAVGEAAGLPSAVIANFSWDWIFRTYLPNHPEFHEIIARIADQYRKTTLLLRTPLSDGFTSFTNIEDIPLIVRRSQLSKKHARKQLGIGFDEKVVLLSFGGMGVKGLSKERLAGYSDVTFVSFDSTLADLPNVRWYDPQGVYHPDVVCASDLVITKLGYGIVTECIAHGVPIAYPPRANFPEHGVLEREVVKYIPLIPLSTEDFSSGNWDFMHNYFALGLHQSDQRRDPILLDGGETAAKRLIALSDGQDA